MKRKNKGEYGYIKYQKVFTCLRTILFFGLSLGVYLIGIKMVGSNKNILTIIAVLGLLPACKSLLNAFMFLKAKGCSEVHHEELKIFDDKLMVLYDLFFTSYDKNYPVIHASIKAGNACILLGECKSTDKDCEAHLEDMMRKEGIKNFNVKVYTDISKYVQRVTQMTELEKADGAGEDMTVKLYKNISL